MKVNFTPILTLLIAVAAVFSSKTTSAQYCSPSFPIGCNFWRNQAITLDAINWTIGSTSCTVSNYTTDTAYLDAGTPYPMTVVNGDWCGCGVWIDLNNDFAFDTTENLFHLYMANDTNTYNFNITVPGNVPTGIYRMRVVAGWGSDTYTSSANGYGPCGSYQYGNFDDFTVSVTNLSTEVEESPSDNSVLIYPNPAGGQLYVTSYMAYDKSVIEIYDFLGQRVISRKSTAPERIGASNGRQLIIDVSKLEPGIYFLTVTDEVNNKVMRRFIKM